MKSALAPALKHVRTALWSSSEYVFYPLLLLIATPVFVALLGKEEFGLWMLVVAVTALSGATNLGMGATTIKFVSACRGCGDLDTARLVVRRTLGYALAAGLLVGALLLACAGPLARHLFPGMGDPERVAFALSIGALLLGIQQADLVFAAVLKGYERFDLAAKLEIGVRSTMLAANLAAAWYWRDAPGVLLASLAVTVAGCGLRAWVAARIAGGAILLPLWRSAAGPPLLGFAGWSWLQSISSSLFQVVDRLIVGSLLGAAPLAAYTICTQLAQQVHALPAAAMAFLFPLISRRIGAGDAAGVHRVRNAGIGATLLVTAALGIVLAAGAGPILRLWMGETFAAEYATLFFWLVAAYALVAVNLAPYYLLLGYGEARYLSLLGIAGGVASLLAMLLLIPAYGLLGAVAGKACYGAILSLAYLRLFRTREASSR